MSNLESFDRAAYSQSSVIIGTVPLVIGTGAAVDAVENKSRHDRESELAGFEASKSLTLVCSRIAFEAAYPAYPDTYLGKLCTVSGVTWRIGNVIDDVNYITLELISETEVA